MSRLAIPARQEAPAAVQPLLDSVEKKLGVTPNVYSLLASSPPVLKGYLALSGELAHVLDLKTRARIALAVAEVNGCDYCLSAHTYVGLNLAKLTEADVALARSGGSSDARSAAAVRFAAEVVRTRGKVSDAELAGVKSAGFTDAQVVEIVAVAVDNVFTNFMNNVADTDIDFPVVRAEAA